MLQIAITACLFLWIVWNARKEGRMLHGRPGVRGTIFGIMVSLALASFAGIIGGSFITLLVPRQWTGPETVVLASVRSIDGISGQFFLGSGIVNTTQYYSYFEKEGESTFLPRTIEVDDNVKVTEEERQGGQLKIYTWQRVYPPWWSWITWVTFTAENPSPPHRYEFSIPPDSIVQNFVLQ